MFHPYLTREYIPVSGYNPTIRAIKTPSNPMVILLFQRSLKRDLPSTNKYDHHVWKITMYDYSIVNTGWWFQTFFIFHFTYGMSSFPLTNS